MEKLSYLETTKVHHISISQKTISSKILSKDVHMASFWTNHLVILIANGAANLSISSKLSRLQRHYRLTSRHLQ